ncbi:AEC family transporter [Marinithermus hydrothermalis]|uniref:Auxin Efflux Carrier n=1 Tax=Marinithermus hydrothermalis (strain DSM 14884 / JCM 11576 / T1) TaxID=869210 RepID=F2NM74_MARHT|nr:AEC family transporter [Marinithermus hydrothermalis]AEB11544.1 Auxin Efflux Carrier [Marinithermus hydrothermalis DSM 14884]
MGALVPIIAPVGFIVLTGFLAGRFLGLPLQPLSRFTLYLLSPALIFDSVYRAALPAESAAGILLGFACTSLALWLLGMGVARLARLPHPTRASLLATTLFPNAGNMGLSVVFFAFGEAGLERAVVYMLGASLLMFGLGPALFRGASLGEGLRFTLRLPLIWAVFAGLAFRLLGLPLPYNLGNAIHMMGQAVIPLALLILGMQIAQSRFKVGVFEGVAGSLRLLAAPVVALGIARLLHLAPLDAKVLVLQSAMPAAVNAFLLSTEFGGDAPRTARVVVASTIAAFLTLPLVLAFLVG